VLHYNGYTFKSFINQTGVNGNYYSVDMKNNIISAVGNDGSRVVIGMGKRVN